MTLNNRVSVWKQRHYDGPLSGQRASQGRERQPSVCAHSIWMTVVLLVWQNFKMALLHDYAWPRTVNTIMALLQKSKWDVVGHSTYSPDLSPCNYAIFGPRKRLWGANDSPRKTTSSSTCGTGSQRSPGNFTILPFTALCRSGTTARANTSDIQVLVSVPRP